VTDTPAIRTVSETDDVHTVEARIAFGGPFNGRDSYGTLFSARTDFGLDLHPQGIPVLYNHGFDPDLGLHPLGFTEPTSAFRVADDGVWVNLQLDKRNAYYATRVRPLLDRGALGVSQGSAEHSVEIDARTGEVIAWPLHEISLTPTEANPWSVIAARTGDTIRIVAALNSGAEAPADEPAAVRGSSDDAAAAAGILGSLFYLRGCELGEDEQVAMLNAAIASVQQFITAEAAEPEPDVEPDAMPAYMSAVRAGRRNAAADLARIDAIHDHTVALGASAHAGDGAQGDDDSGESEADAARSGGSVPAIRIVEPDDPDAERRRISELAATAAEAALRAFRGDVG
jgi:hypothetical protein